MQETVNIEAPARATTTRQGLDYLEFWVLSFGLGL